MILPQQGLTAHRGMGRAIGPPQDRWTASGLARPLPAARRPLPTTRRPLPTASPNAIRSLPVLLTTLLLLLLPGAASGQPSELVFPVQGEHRVSDHFGVSRPQGRRHQGLDIAAAKMTPVVAVAAGTVESLQDTPGGPCCAITLRHDDDWQSRYLHLNDDSPGSDDGRAVGIAQGLRPGARVAAGELIGWVGDSGNATAPHLHFELRRPDGTAVDPAPYLSPGVPGEAFFRPRRRPYIWRLLLVALLVAATLVVRHRAGDQEASR